MVAMKVLSASGPSAARNVSNPRPRQPASPVPVAPVPSTAKASLASKKSKAEWTDVLCRATATAERPPSSSDVAGLIDTVWEQKKMQQPPRFPKLDRDLEVDVCIVGAGISGLSVAYALVKEGKSVAVLEGRVVGGGQTGRTTAHLMPWNDDYYHIQEFQLGDDERLRMLGESHMKAIDWVENTVKAEGIECKFERVDGYLFPYMEIESDYKKLEQEIGSAHKAGLTNVQWVDLGGDPKYGSVKTCLKFPGAGDFHPLMYINGLADSIASDKYGGHVFEMTRVIDQDGKTVKTKEGHTVRAKDAVVLATNSPINKNLALHPRQHPGRSYVLGFEVPKGSVAHAQWWDTASPQTPYHYIRIEQQDDHDILVVGGGDHLTGPKPHEYPPSYETLEEYTRKRWPMAGEIKYRWTGQVMEPVDLIGLYGLDPLNPAGDTYIATGDSGQGMTGGTIAGIVISQQILGLPCPWKKLYDPNRVPASLPGLAQLAEEAQTTIQSYGDILLPKLPKSLDSVEPGSGAVLQVGTDKVAAYRDPDGTLKTFSAVCPHLKCSVMYNPKDNTFDCPCHGSHFDTNGECIQGPAKNGLYPLDK